MIVVGSPFFAAVAASSRVSPIIGATHLFDANDLPDGPVSSWVAGASGLTISQATPSLQPVAASWVAGQKAVTADGADDYLRTASVSAGSQPSVVYVAGEWSNDAGGAVFDGGTSAGSSQRWLLRNSNPAGSVEAYAGTLQTVASTFDATRYVCEIVFNGASSTTRIRFDGQSEQTFSGNLGTGSLAVGLTMFNSAAASAPSSGKIAIWASYATTLNASRRDELMGIFQQKAQVTVV